MKVYHERRLLTTRLFFPDPLIDQIYADVEPYKSHVMLTARVSIAAMSRIHAMARISFFNEIAARPMAVERPSTAC